MDFSLASFGVWQADSGNLLIWTGLVGPSFVSEGCDLEFLIVMVKIHQNTTCIRFETRGAWDTLLSFIEGDGLTCYVMLERTAGSNSEWK